MIAAGFLPDNEEVADQFNGGGQAFTKGRKGPFVEYDSYAARAGVYRDNLFFRKAAGLSTTEPLDKMYFFRSLFGMMLRDAKQPLWTRCSYRT